MINNYFVNMFNSLHRAIMIPVCFIFISFLQSYSCKSPRENESAVENNSQENTEVLIRNQQNIIRDESDEIESYISRKNYRMTSTATGLRYMIYQNGSGVALVKDDDKVTIKYKVSLLDGSKVYDSDESGPLKMQIGKSEVASGLHEGLKLLKEGDKAIFILPSHLAYGLTGDGDKIKQYQVLVIDVELSGINKIEP